MAMILSVSFLKVELMEWELSGDFAKCVHQGWSATMNPKKPSLGLNLSQGSTSCDLLSVSPKPGHSLIIQEAYVRQSDLIVKYAQSDCDAYGFQLDWRKRDCDLIDAIAIELWVSIQTNLLDTHPELDIASQVIGGHWKSYSLKELGEDGHGVGVFECPLGSGTALMMIQSSDVIQCHPTASTAGPNCSLKLFGQFLEKGVIRRARFFAIAARNTINEDKLREIYLELTSSPLPLTA
jgi:hypothetical protein